MIASLRLLGLALLISLNSAAECGQPLTAADLDSARAFFGDDEGEPYVLEIGGWRQDQRSEGDPIQAYAYVSLIQPNRLLDRLCVVETRWTQGLVVDETAKWLEPLFQITYAVWESDATDCAITNRSQIPEHISLAEAIDGLLLLRIIDRKKALLKKALAYLPEDERKEHENARLVSIDIDHFMYTAKFQTNRGKGVSVIFSDTPDGFKIHKASKWVH